MSLTKLVSCAFLILVVAIAAAQKPTTIADASIEVTEQGWEDATKPELLGRSEDQSQKKYDYKRNEISGKDLDSEEYSDEYDYGEVDDNIDYDYDSDENDADKEEDDAESSLRVKRKVIFGGGGAGGGGIYSRGGRRGGGEEDPYGRRRDNGPMYGPPESWPYRRPDLPSHAQNAGQVTPSTTGSSPSTGSSDSSAPVYGTPRLSPDDDGSSSTSSSSSSSSSTTTSSRRNDNRKTKPNRRDTQKGKLSKTLKWEIAQYAMEHGPEKAAQHFEERVGRRLRVKKIQKFIQRYQTKN